MDDKVKKVWKKMMKNSIGLARKNDDSVPPFGGHGEASSAANAPHYSPIKQAMVETREGKELTGHDL